VNEPPPTREDLVGAILETLGRYAGAIRAQWAAPSGTPTRHFVVDDVLPAAWAAQIHAAFPADADGFAQMKSFRESKRTSAELSDHDPLLSDVTHAIQDQRIIDAVAQLVEMPGLEPDPGLYAGGLSMMFTGDFLNPHLDNSHDANHDRYRRLNLLFYTSPDWSEEAGGNFELWSADRTTPKTIVSQANRLVVMETNRSSYHSVNTVVADRPRCCVSNYYFSVASPDGEEYDHVTEFAARPGSRARQVLSRLDNTVRNFAQRRLNIRPGRERDPS